MPTWDWSAAGAETCAGGEIFCRVGRAIRHQIRKTLPPEARQDEAVSTLSRDCAEAEAPIF